MSSSGLPLPAGVERTTERPIEDCRDYLRTGRCKYGASCKYYHPPNVQSGGGMKTPTDPSEPLFPLRPNEPVCQYYMKHGTCKFGQACKFHHPPTANPPVGAAGMNRRIEAPRLILNPVGPDGASMMLQFLPQRPEEPDCIYFLKNGRCKYGATCRYHHPINGSFQQRRHEEARRARIATDQFVNKLQYVNQPGFVPNHSTGPDSPVAFVSVDGAPQFAPVAILKNNDPYCIPVANTVATEQASSTSSIASSHDASGSTFEYIAVPSDQASALWQRARRNGSGGSLKAYVDQPRHPRARMHTSSSDGSIARRGRAGSTGDPSYGHYESAPPAEPSWRPTRSSSFDHTRRVPSMGEQRSPSLRGRPPPRAGPRNPHRTRQGHGDEGFTMMTSALLNMLDTPEETTAEVYSEDGTYHYGFDDDASRMIEGLSLGTQETVPTTNPDYEDVRWSPSWQRLDTRPPVQDIPARFLPTQAAPQHRPPPYDNQHISPTSEHSDFGHYLP